MSGELNKKIYRVLFMHGYRQNQKMFYERTGGLRKFLKNRVELIYCEAPHDVPKKVEEAAVKQETENSLQASEEKAEEINSAEKGWWLKSSECPERNFESDFKKTLQYINEVFEANQPIDGVWGFSMGGIFSSMLAKIALENSNTPSISEYKAIRFNFVIIAAASKSVESFHEQFYDLSKKISMPSLHIIGKADKLVAEEKALQLADYFDEPQVYIHEQGHFIPCNAESKKAYSDFLDRIK